MFQSLGLLGSIIGLVGLMYVIRGLSTVVNDIRIAMTPINVEWAAKYGLGSWAVITGCTEGIGKAFSFTLAEIRFNLCLISRNKAKLETLQAELKAKYPMIETRIIVADFSSYSTEFYDRIVGQIGDLDVSILVNNVGVAKMNPLFKQTTEQLETQINTNVNTTTHLTHRLINKMFKRSFRSGIINLSSNSVLVPFPTLSVYSGTKAFDDVFSRCLTEDCKNTNIDVVSSRPNLVSTNATNHTKVLMACSPESTALGTLKALGKSSFTEGSFFHVFQTWFVYIMGEHIGRIFGSLTFNTMNKKKTA